MKRIRGTIITNKKHITGLVWVYWI